ncbi:MAG: hypothetical protein JO316_07515 [Abitibacteriaceae bacterium]|nr:hypothetical protein [Abditibacteriaceae bacterium]MBV9865184.1 hypothetical protein [Abditibacteriaceae bacterium]
MFKPLEPIILLVSIKNMGASSLSLVDQDRTGEGDFTFIIKNSLGQIMPATRYGNRSGKQDFYRAFRFVLKPGEERKYRFTLNRLVDMTEGGAYSIMVKRKFGQAKNASSTEIVSDILNVGVGNPVDREGSVFVPGDGGKESP